MTRAKGTGILTFIRVWETKFEKVKKLGVNISNISGIDLLYACNLIKDDRNLIGKDLDALKMIYTRQNVANSIRKCFHHEVLKTEDLELVMMQELNKEVKHRRFLSWLFNEEQVLSVGLVSSLSSLWTCNDSWILVGVS